MERDSFEGWRPSKVPSKGEDLRRYLRRVGTFEGTLEGWRPSKVPSKGPLKGPSKAPSKGLSKVVDL